MSTRALLWAGLLAATAACLPPPSHTSQVAPRPPEPVSMDPASALGLWHSDFGAVKIEPDVTLGPDGLMGVWVYEREGQEVIGLFSGRLRGNVLEFTWNEPAQPQDLTGAGFVAFDAMQGQFSGRWWTDDQRRSGTWMGWRQPHAGAGGELQGNPYGGSSYGDSHAPPEPDPYPY